ncbi:hypothetical protein KY290_005905 [Solanum tuberosum]|uniref:RNase H family protein n=1 Tax=Solanum tuberosum TaxID=4113 RepID=A0ABQ7WFI9_SOLTU|nr:hypothetical protein KY290_005905 [Solanum tuberosum]
MFAKVKRPTMRGGSWPEILKEIEEYRPKIKVVQVKWEIPPAGWIKYNMDGEAKGCYGFSSYAYCLRDENGDIIFAEGARIENTTSTMAKAVAILEASKHCKNSQYNQTWLSQPTTTKTQQFGGYKVQASEPGGDTYSQLKVAECSFQDTHASTIWRNEVSKVSKAQGNKGVQ